MLMNCKSTSTCSTMYSILKYTFILLNLANGCTFIERAYIPTPNVKFTSNKKREKERKEMILIKFFRSNSTAKIHYLFSAFKIWNQVFPFMTQQIELQQCSCHPLCQQNYKKVNLFNT